MKHAIARIRWRPPHEGGRTRPVTGVRYMAPVRVGSEESGEAWTLVVNRSREEAREEETALVHFLLDDAPHEWLEHGMKFQLQEGAFVVADGVVSETFELSAAA